MALDNRFVSICCTFPWSVFLRTLLRVDFLPAGFLRQENYAEDSEQGAVPGSDEFHQPGPPTTSDNIYYVKLRKWLYGLAAFAGSDYPVGGLRFSSFLPHTNLVAFILGYLSDSITKYLTKRIPFLKNTVKL